MYESTLCTAFSMCDESAVHKVHHNPAVCMPTCRPKLLRSGCIYRPVIWAVLQLDVASSRVCTQQLLQLCTCLIWQVCQQEAQTCRLVRTKVHIVPGKYLAQGHLQRQCGHVRVCVVCVWRTKAGSHRNMRKPGKKVAAG